MSMEYANRVRAVAAVTASVNGPGVVPTFAWSYGITQASCLHEAAGVYTLTLDQPIDASQCLLIASPRGAGLQSTFAVADTSDAVKTVTTYAAGVEDDTINFNFVVMGAPNT